MNNKTVAIWHAQNRMYYVYQNTNRADAFERFVKEFNYRVPQHFITEYDRDAVFFALPSEP